MNNTDTIVLGHSHTSCIQNAITQENLQDKIKVFSLHTNKTIFDVNTKILDRAFFQKASPKKLILSIEGNYHNIFSLIESPEPFTIADTQNLSEDRKKHWFFFDKKPRWYIPYNMVKLHFKENLKGVFDTIKAIAEQTPDAKKFVLMPPPPIADSEHLTQYPGVFKDRVKSGIMPKEIRLSCYQIQIELLEELCASLSVTCIYPPKEALDEQGFIAPAYRNADPTHGNIHYGELVLAQIKQLA